MLAAFRMLLMAGCVVAVMHTTTARAADPAEAGDAGGAATGNKVGGQSSSHIIISGASGPRKEFHFQGQGAAGAVQVLSATESDGTVHGKIVIIGADGVAREIPFGTANPPQAVPVAAEPVLGPASADPQAPASADPNLAPTEPPSHRIGLAVTPASDVLRAQFKLPEDQGLVVRAVLADSPAAKAGIQQFDILLKSGDKSLGNLPDLVRAVEEAGEHPLTITLIRGGQEQSVEVTPVKAERLNPPFVVSPYSAPPQPPLYWRDAPEGVPGNFEMRLPPMFRQRAEDTEQRLKALEDEVASLRKQLEELRTARPPQPQRDE